MKAFVFVVMLCISACASAQNRIIPTPNYRLIEQVKRSLVQVNFPVDEENHAVCAGFSVSASRGWILTAAHCVRNGTETAENITVNAHPATIVSVDDQFAMLKVEAQKYPPLDIYQGTSHVGDRVLNFGYGFGEFTLLPRSVALVSEGDIWLDGPTLKGMSGGPIVDMAGRVVGLNQASAVVGIACGAGEIRAFIRAAENGRTQ
jgi:S1-C subfamily serine protease